MCTAGRARGSAFAPVLAVAFNYGSDTGGGQGNVQSGWGPCHFEDMPAVKGGESEMRTAG